MTVTTWEFPFDATAGSGARFQGLLTATRDTSTQIITMAIEAARVAGTGGVYVNVPAGGLPADMRVEAQQFIYTPPTGREWTLNTNGSASVYLSGAGPISDTIHYYTPAPIVIPEPEPEPTAGGVLGDLRRELADEIAGPAVELTVYDHVPARVQLPAAFVMPGQPYIEQGDTFGRSLVRFSAVLLTQPSLSADETDQLDERIESVQRRLLDAGYVIERVERPELQDLNGAEVLATALSVACGATFP